MEISRTPADLAVMAEQVRSVLETRGLPDGQMQAQTERTTSSRVQVFVRRDPAPVLRRGKGPVLVLCDSKALQASPSDDGTVRVLYQPTKTGPPEYSQLETTVAPRALRAVSGWIRARPAAN